MKVGYFVFITFICVLLLYLIISGFSSGTYQATQMKENQMAPTPRRAIVFLTHRPPGEAYSFWKALAQYNPSEYEVFVCVDDNEHEIPGYDGAVPLIKIDAETCEEAGFNDTVDWFYFKAVSRDKALFWLSFNNRFEHVWLLEEDVFVPALDTLARIDAQYPDEDLLSATHNIVVRKSQLRTWAWPKIRNKIRLPLPWAKSMICGIRVSRALLECVSAYAQAHGSLFMDEALFNTLALHNGLRVATPPELSTIVFRHKWQKEDIIDTNLYHPVKNMARQRAFRKHTGNSF